VTSLAQHAKRAFAWPFPSDFTDPYGFGAPSYFAVGQGAVSPSMEPPPGGFQQLVNGPFKGNATVFACEQKRISVFSEARFVYRTFNQGRPGKLWSNADLQILETPWPRGTTGDLLARMIQNADIGGNAYVARTQDAPDRLRVLRPDWVTIVMGDSSGRPVESAAQLDAEIIGFIYAPKDGYTEPETLLAEEVAHFAPIPDPLARFRGMSWLTPVIREVQADQAATMHKLSFFENGATPQMVVKVGDPTMTQEQFQKFVYKMDDNHAGWRNAYKTLYLGGGADATVVGANLQQLEFSATQGKGETRIAAASGIHPIIVPVSEGLQGSSLNAGNYMAARRITADGTFRPLWRNVCGSLAPILPVPAGSELWYDEQNIAFLREDASDAAKIQQVMAETISGLVREGFTADSAVQAVLAQDMSLLKHTGLVSVQLQPLSLMSAQPKPTGLLPAQTNGSKPAELASANGGMG
jgi:phage portal protein BeeE